MKVLSAFQKEFVTKKTTYGSNAMELVLTPNRGFRPNQCWKSNPLKSDFSVYI